MAYTFDNQLGNTTPTVSGDNLTITADEGYYFTKAPYLAQYNANGGVIWTNRQTTLSADKKTATFNLATVKTVYNEERPITIYSGAVVAQNSVTGNTEDYTVVNNIANTTYEITDGVLKIHAGFGWVFNAKPTVKQTQNGSVTTQRPTLSTDKKTATLNLNGSGYLYDMTGTITLTGAVVAVNDGYTVENNIENSDYEIVSDFLTIKAKDGYKFQSAPTLSQEDEADVTCDLSEDSKTATKDLNTTDFVASLTTTLNGTTVEDVPDITDTTVENEISNTTYVKNDNEIVITANEGYKFETAPKVNNYNSTDISWSVWNEIECTLSADGKTASADVSDLEGDTLTLTGSVTEDTGGGGGDNPDQPDSNYDVVNEIEHTTFTVNGNVVTLTADEGYKFSNAPTADNFESGAPLDQRMLATFILSADKKTATVDLSDYGEDHDSLPTQYQVTLRGTVVVDVVYQGFYGSINVYEVTEDNLQAFAEKRFYSANEDLGKYVSKLFRLFVPVGETLSAVITCGNINTNIQAQTPKNDLQVLDFGTVIVPFHNHNLTDFNSDIQIFLPFIGFVKLDTKYLGLPVNLTYVVNIITGDAVARLSFNDSVFAVYDCNVSSEVIYKTSNYNTIGNIAFDSKFLYGLQPYVNVVWRHSRNEYVRNSDCERIVIGTVNGFARLTECSELSASQMTADEKTMIINQLNTGVYVEQQS